MSENLFPYDLDPALARLCSTRLNEKERCEASRYVFGNVLAITAHQPGYWDDELLVRLDDAFAAAVQQSRGYYQANILDRWIDLTVLRNAGYFSKKESSSLAYLHVLWRGYRREIQRISTRSDDHGYGRDVLSTFGNSTRQLFVDTYSKIKITDDRKRLAEHIAGELMLMLGYVADKACAEEVLIRRCEDSCKAIEELFQELAAVQCEVPERDQSFTERAIARSDVMVPAPESYLEAKVLASESSLSGWFQELPRAYKAEFVFCRPARPEIVDVEALQKSIQREGDTMLRGVLSTGKVAVALGGMPKMPDAESLPVLNEVADSFEFFCRDLPQLLAEHRGEWAAYVGSKRISVEKDGVALQNRLEAGMKEGVALFYIDSLDVDDSLPFSD